MLLVNYNTRNYVNNLFRIKLFAKRSYCRSVLGTLRARFSHHCAYYALSVTTHVVLTHQRYEGFNVKSTR